jgi:peptidoglycan/LPS O-acetylase OafA/YrhL
MNTELYRRLTPAIIFVISCILFYAVFALHPDTTAYHWYGQAGLMSCGAFFVTSLLYLCEGYMK